jgi:hypothetical protein
VGCYAINGLYQDFVRDPDGVITTINLPGTTPDCVAAFIPGFIQVVPQSVVINDQGTMIGYFTNAAKVSIGFVRAGDGRTIALAYPGSKQTIPTSINNCDVITGYYSHGQDMIGFIREL